LQSTEGEQGMNWQKIAKRVRVPLGFAFAVFYIWLSHPTWNSLLAGAAVALLGVWIRAYASGYVNKNESLACTGPYAYTRNPLYLGSVVIGAGFAIAAMNLWIAIAMLIMYIVIYVPVIRGEEAFLTSRFPEFVSYAKSVPRLLPRMTAARLGSGGSGGFSRELYLKHREYNALIGTLAMLGVLVVKLIRYSH
jgi:protein-S-isoprenylcysteine O-methyltransferase Ste14